MSQRVETNLPVEAGPDPAAPRLDQVRVVLGPKTRLGRTLLRRSEQAGRTAVAVARHTHDLDGTDLGPALVADASTGAPVLGDARPRSLQVLVCALGPVHPGPPHFEADSAAVSRDLATVQRLLETPGVEESHVVLVSSVIALAAGPDRRYYGGWKGVVEQELCRLVDRHPHARLSTLYPGRLMQREERVRPWHRMHTSYDRLAALVERAADGPGSTRVVGLDARAWLLLRAAAVATGGRSGSTRHGGQVLMAADSSSTEESWGDR